MEIELHEKKGILKARLDGRIMDALRDLPGRSRWVNRELHFEPSAANINHLKEAFPTAQWIDRSNRLEALHTISEMERDSLIQKRAPIRADAFPFKTKPRDHQLRHFLWARDRTFWGSFMEMGTGKTKANIDVMAYKWAKGDIDCVLVVAPNGVHRQWLEPKQHEDPSKLGEVVKHMPEFVNYVDHTYRSGKKIPPALFERGDKLRILAINVEALSHKSGFDVVWAFVHSGRCLILVDESTTIKNHSSKRAANLLKLRKASVARAILCGAPVTRGLEDLYGQFLFLSEDILGFSSFYTFRNRYCDTVPAYHGAPQGVVRIVGYRHLAEFTKKVEAHTFRVTKAECLDLPPKVYLERLVELTPEQKKLYKDVAEECFMQLGERIIDVPNAITKIMRLQQVVCGHVPGEFEGTYEIIPSNRVKAVMDWLEETSGKVVLWARFKPDIDQLCRAIAQSNRWGADAVVRYDGSVPEKQRQADKDRWLSSRTSGPMIMVANQAAAARGQNWQIATDVGYFSNSFDADHRWQSEDRTHRDGMVGTCTYTDFVAPGVDRKILNSLRTKKNVADGVLDDPQGWIRAIEAGLQQ